MGDQREDAMRYWIMLVFLLVGALLMLIGLLFGVLTQRESRSPAQDIHVQRWAPGGKGSIGGILQDSDGALIVGDVHLLAGAGTACLESETPISTQTSGTPTPDVDGDNDWSYRFAVDTEPDPATYRIVAKNSGNYIVSGENCIQVEISDTERITQNFTYVTATPTLQFDEGGEGGDDGDDGDGGS